MQTSPWRWLLLLVLAASLLTWTACDGCGPDCSSDGECLRKYGPSWVCSLNTCIAAGCFSDLDCPQSTPLCQRRRCVIAVPENPPPREGLPELLPVCPQNEASCLEGLFRACQLDSQCPENTRCTFFFAWNTKLCSWPCDSNQNCRIYHCHKPLPTRRGWCLPQCQTDESCRRYSHLPQCHQQLCARRARIGGLCSDAKHCEAGLECLHTGGYPAGKLCTRPCTKDDECGSGFICTKGDGIDLKHCLPACPNGDADCRGFPHLPSCSQNKHCWAKGKTGTLCATDQECLPDLKCADPGDLGRKICHKICESTGLCSVEDTPTACRRLSNRRHACLPKCDSDEQCKPYPHMPLCQTGTCWRR